MDFGQFLRGILFLLSLAVVGVLVVGTDEAARLVGLELQRPPAASAAAQTPLASDGVDNPSPEQGQGANVREPQAVRTITYSVGNESHQGALFAPDGVQGSFPVLIVLDYWSAETAVVEHWKAAAESAGWLVVTTKQVHRGTSAIHDRAEYQGLLSHVAKLHPIDRNRVLITGFSAAGVGAYDLALENPDVFLGAIPQGAHGDAWRRRTHFTRKPMRFYMFAADGDFNVSHSAALTGAMRSKGYRVAEGTGPGGHRKMNTFEQIQALYFFDT